MRRGKREGGRTPRRPRDGAQLAAIPAFPRNQAAGYGPISNGAGAFPNLLSSRPSICYSNYAFGLKSVVSSFLQIS